MVAYSLCVSVSCADIPLTYTDRGNLDSDAGQRKACRFSKSLLGRCSGESDPTFGFSKGKPCIIVKLNRIVNYRPRVGMHSTRFVIRRGDKHTAIKSKTEYWIIFAFHHSLSLWENCLADYLFFRFFLFFNCLTTETTEYSVDTEQQIMTTSNILHLGFYYCCHKQF